MPVAEVAMASNAAMASMVHCGRCMCSIRSIHVAPHMMMMMPIHFYYISLNTKITKGGRISEKESKPHWLQTWQQKTHFHIEWISTPGRCHHCAGQSGSVVFD